MQQSGRAFFGKISASVSHELNNVLAIIGQTAGLLEDLLDSGPGDEPIPRASLERICSQITEQVGFLNEPLHVPDLEHVVPYVRARAILQENPEHIVVLECPCRTYKENPCLPLDVCLVIGEPFASFIMQHNPEKARSLLAVFLEKLFLLLP